ncbi:MAG TPA: CheR family methyltransferase [Gallionella sp.]|nr:CheR family methyltransferase [Gallionella sp.]
MSADLAREFHFTAQDFRLISKLIHQRAGISLAESKQELVYSRVARRLRATGIKSFAEYLDHLQRGDVTEWEEFINSLTTNLTSFFREAHHFQILTEHLRKLGKTRPIELWCSACSTGEEAYSLAMTAVDAFAGFDNPVRIVASDLDTRVLEIARAGRYSLESVARIPVQQIDKFFVRGKDEHAGYVQVRPELQKKIIFRQVNLLDRAWPIREKLDVIFCRNVMIYFDKATQLAILKKFAPLMRGDGLLFAGHSENFFHADAYFKLRGQTVYELSEKLKSAHR